MEVLTRITEIQDKQEKQETGEIRLAVLEILARL
jgi:hypothetical protein